MKEEGESEGGGGGGWIEKGVKAKDEGRGRE